MNLVTRIAQEIKNAKNIIIFHHVAPDGDSLGTALALKEMIEQLDPYKRIDNVITSYIPELYKFLPSVESFKNINNPDLLNSYELGIAVDCASKDRLGDSQNLFNQAKKTISLDHHITNFGFADLDLINPRASATGEVLYSLIEPLGVKITPGIATNIYTAILTDTGGFKFENTKPETLRICAELIEAGADPVEIYKQCYESKPAEMVKLHARAIDNAVYIENSTVAYTKITRELLNELDATDDYIDGITEALRQINVVKIAIVFKETTRGTTRVSFRSNGIDVSEIAGFFGGGGHKLAAGCTLEKTVEESASDVLKVVVNQLEKAEART